MSTVLQIPCGRCGSTNRVPQSRLADVPVCGRCRERLFPATPIALDDESFDRFVSRSDLPVLVDFWATWCGPCRTMAPHFEQAAAQHAGRILFAKLDTDAAPRTSSRHAIESIPTLLLFRSGHPIARHSGALTSPQITSWLARESPG